MKRIQRGFLVSVVFMVFLQVFAGCSGDDGDRGHVFTAEIMSDQPSDGHIGVHMWPPDTITNGPPTLLFGIDGSLREFRAFLSFPLDGFTGQDVVPSSATIESATLIVNIVGMGFAATVPTRLDLVTYISGALKSSDYDAPPLNFSNSVFAASRKFKLYHDDVGHDVVIDVTLLMREAQTRGLLDFQVRFCLDFLGAAGFVSIDDRPDVALTAPLLTVHYL